MIAIMAIQAEMLGIRLIGPSPLGRVEVRMDRGLTVIGGVNGAGKSTLLKALEEAFTGKLEILDRAEIFVQFSDAAEARNQKLAQWICDGIVIGRNSVDSLTVQDIFEKISDRAQSEDMGGWGFFAPSQLSQSEVSERERLCAEICLQSTIAFVLQKSSHLGAGQVISEWYLAGKPGDKSPLLTELLEVDDDEWKSRAGGGYFPNFDESELRSLGQPEEAMRPGPTRAEYDSDPDYCELRWRFHSEFLPFAILATSRAPGRRYIPDLMANGFNVESFQPLPDPDGATMHQLVAYRARQMARSSDGGTITWSLAGHELEADDPNALLVAAVEWAADVENAATEMWKSLRPDHCQSLHCTVTGDARRWAEGKPFVWTTTDPPTGHDTLVGQLGDGQQRWANLAIAFALTTEGTHEHDRKSPAEHVWLLDEPELGLHRTAEAGLGQRLRDLAIERGIRVVTATHSSAFMTAADELLRVERDGPRLCTTTVKDAGEHAGALGLTPSDLMGWYEIFIAVEGTHDQVVLEGVIGTDLERLRAKILPLRGGKNLASALNCRWLLDFTDAYIAGLLDNINPAQSSEIWKAAQQICSEQDYDAAKVFLDKEMTGRGVEWKKFLKDFMLEALGSQLTDRTVILGLPETDILRYVAPKDLCSTMPETWEQVAQAYYKNKEQEGPPGPWAPDKKWIEKNYGFEIGQVLPSAAAAMGARNERHEDFDRLLDSLDEVLTSRRLGSSNWTRAQFVPQESP